ncbi:MAG: hypothetical protein M1828_004462 [Chrysothrix sp. TS-e1954]|nr:MAG: hypothetical protein M1828_004462 [Chrysothrix sp. TS-e1954]
MPTKKKIYLSGLFALGTFTVATSIVRITYIYGVKTQIWYNLAIGNLWTNLETTLGITCASLPPSVPFFRHVYESRSTWSQSASRLISTPRSRHRDPYSTGRSGRSDGYRDVETGSGSDGTRLVNGSGHAATASADGHVPHPPSIHKDGAQTPRTKEDYALNAIYIKKDTDVYPTDQHSPI